MFLVTFAYDNMGLLNLLTPRIYTDWGLTRGWARGPQLGTRAEPDTLALVLAIYMG